MTKPSNNVTGLYPNNHNLNGNHNQCDDGGQGDTNGVKNTLSINELANTIRGEKINVKHPQSPNFLWNLLTAGMRNEKIDPKNPAHKDYLHCYKDYTDYLSTQGVSFKSSALSALGSLNSFTPSLSEIFFMMDEMIYELIKESNLKGTVSIYRESFAKICLNYTPPHLIGVEKSHDMPIGNTYSLSHNGSLLPDAHIVINTLNDNLLFEPTYEVFFDKQVIKGKLYSDNDFFKFNSVAEKALKQCFPHLLRFAQAELNQSSRDYLNQLLPSEIRETHYISNKQEAEAYITSYVLRLERYLDENPQLRACWIPIEYEELTMGGNKPKDVRLFAFRPRSIDGTALKPLLYVDFQPDTFGAAPAFSKSAQLMLDAEDGSTFEQNDDIEKLIEQITDNALPKDRNGKYGFKPMLELLHYWFIGLYK